MVSWELQLIADVELGPWALLWVGFTSKWLRSRNPWWDSGCEDIQVSNPKTAPYPDNGSTDPDSRDSGDPPPLYIFNYRVVTVHKLASQARWLLDRFLTASRSLGSRHHMAHRSSCLAPCTSLSPAFGKKTCFPPSPHVCCL